VQPESQLEGPAFQPVQTKSSGGPESRIVGPEHDLENHDEPSEFRKKEPRLAGYVRRHHALEKIIGHQSEGAMTRNKLKGTCFLTKFKPRTIKDALENEIWIEAMNEEIDHIERNKTWTLVPRPKDKNVIGTKWVFRNKLNENGKVPRNKARLVCNVYAQEEGIGYGETFAPISRVEGVRTLLAYVAHKGFKLY
jgi:hypothetical protein